MGGNRSFYIFRPANSIGGCDPVLFGFLDDESGLPPIESFKELRY